MSTPTKFDRKAREYLGLRLKAGLLLLLFSVGLAIFAGDNFWAIGLGWLTFLAAMILVVTGTLQNQPFKKASVSP